MSTQFILDDISLLKESNEVECKLAGGKDGNGQLPKSFWETYSAFANTSGGYIFLGVEEKKGQFNPVGIKNIDNIKKVLFDSLNNRTCVSVNLLKDEDVKTHTIDGKNILCINVPRAYRTQQPVFLKNNPLGNTYIRRHEGDYKLSDSEVKRLLAEQCNDSRDNGLLKNYTLADLDQNSLRSYRQLYANLDHSHPFNDLDNLCFFKNIGALKIDRENKNPHEDIWLTAAGLLMFGTHQVIQEIYPNYMLDFQESFSPNTERWDNRITLDGKWSGNLFEFYRKVYRSLTEDLKVPFKLVDGVRQEDTPVHIALREALVNTLVHADYSGRASIKIIKKPDMFEFRNPGRMRIPVDRSLIGGESDCRNRLIHQMFRYIKAGEQAGSGIPKILSGWADQHWRTPNLFERDDPSEQTVLELHKISLFPPHILKALEEKFADRFRNLSRDEKTILAITMEDRTSQHRSLKTVIQKHPIELSRMLHNLVQLELLECTGERQGKVYFISGEEPLVPTDVFGQEESELYKVLFEDKSPNSLFSLEICSFFLNHANLAIYSGIDELQLGNSSLDNNSILSETTSSLLKSKSSLLNILTSLGSIFSSLSDTSSSLSDPSSSLLDPSSSLSEVSSSLSEVNSLLLKIEPLFLEDSTLFSEDDYSHLKSCFSRFKSSLSPLGGVIAYFKVYYSSLNKKITANKNKNRDIKGRLIYKKLALPIIDDISQLETEFLSILEKVAEDAKQKKRLDKNILSTIITNLCRGHFITLQCLSILVNRTPESLRNKYLTDMVRSKILVLAFPSTPTHKDQAYSVNCDNFKDITDD